MMRILIISGYKEWGGFTVALDGLCQLPGVEVWQYGRWKGDKFGALTPDSMLYTKHLDHQAITSEEQAREQLRQKKFDCIVATTQARDVSLKNLHPVKVLAKLRFARKFGSTDAKERSTLGANILPFWDDVIGDTPVLGIDTFDDTLVHPPDMPLFLRSKLFFKSNLPYKYSSNFVERDHKGGNLYLDESEKFRPFSLGISEDRYQELRALRVPPGGYKYDVFAAIWVRNTIRKRALAELRKLQEKSKLKILIPEDRIPPEEFYRLCSESRVTLSPEGGGWDCARHYESIACGSIPFMNRPNIHTRWPKELLKRTTFEEDFSDYGAKLEELVEASHRPDLLNNLTHMVEERFTRTTLMRYVLTEAGFNLKA
jgi:hypothetical protein